MTSPLSSSSPSPSLTFADLLRQHRVAAGLTQGELAERARLSADAISTLERGTRRAPRKETAALLAGALALTPEERAAFALAARRPPAAALAATPAEGPVYAAYRSRATADGHDRHDGHDPTPATTASTDLPHGTVTFLFADIEGSTRLLHQLGGDQYAEALATLQALLRTVWAAHAGHELGTQGDHFFVVFADADDALAAAAEAQRALAAQGWPDGAQVRIRMGVHSGAALLTVGRYVGLEVHRAARVAATGHGGQVVVSQAVVDQFAQVGYVLPEGARLRDLGAHRLRDLGRRERLAQLELPGLPVTFPPLRTQDVWPGVRAELLLVGVLTLALLTLAGMLLPPVVPTFPHVLGQVAGGAALVVLAVGARPPSCWGRATTHAACPGLRHWHCR